MSGHEAPPVRRWRVRKCGCGHRACRAWLVYRPDGWPIAGDMTHGEAVAMAHGKSMGDSARRYVIGGRLITRDEARAAIFGGFT